MAKVLFVLTASDKLTLADGTEHPTGYWAEEYLAPAAAILAAGHEIVVASPGGVRPPVDPVSLDPEATTALESATALHHPVPLETIDPADFDAVFYPGGHGPMEDLAGNADSARILRAAMAEAKPLALVCHGLAALLATETPEGNPFTGYRLTGFTREEETLAGLADKVTWNLEDRLVALGTNFVAGEPWAPHVVVDRNLYTGQNPGSSAALGAEFVKALG